MTGVGLLSIYRRVVEPHVKPGGHRRLAVFATGFVVGLPVNALMQFLWLKVDLFVYTQAAGPVLDVAGRQLPLYMVIYDSFLFAVVAVLCVPDDRGRPAFVARVAQRLPIVGGPPTTPRLLAVAIAVLMTAVAVPIAVFSLLRVGGFATPSYDEYPYPAVKVYDPYGDLERAGKPGPFYR
ncbi:spirocyclase AveC family protein [Mycolicibacterium arenosum]|uniref:Spirocyclase AveC family protein n=1 Tax=Mycolicibacterium arenosum TaxID=2952157 RepID=A0ABT1M5S2_9MYCO|nr:spirocyclase AveC family protein [Mycolicibacterium sp. CAU 1645]MCP9274516.1 spirocyclase AveC family protein [Mycolicibacterium sp. CAU 1645]